jgi:hypothetical protein
MKISEYVDNTIKKYTSGITSKHTYREYILDLVRSKAPLIQIETGPGIPLCSAPDLICTKQNMLVGYIKILDIDQSLDNKDNYAEKHYIPNKKSLSNIILTNHLRFYLYHEGVLKACVSIAEIQDGEIIPRPGDYPHLDELLEAFCNYQRPALGSASDVSVTMARKAKLLACAIESGILQDEKAKTAENEKGLKNALNGQFRDTHNVLRSDTTANEYSDIYAQTISYGMFAARLYGGCSMEEFSIKTAAGLIPSSYSFLHGLFQYLAGDELDERIAWIIKEITDVFRNVDIAALLNDFKSINTREDPVRLFYDTFLDEYNPQFRERRNAFNKPETIVAFIKKTIMHCK